MPRMLTIALALGLFGFSAGMTAPANGLVLRPWRQAATVPLRHDPAGRRLYAVALSLAKASKATSRATAWLTIGSG
jgi:hypothetical protein